MRRVIIRSFCLFLLFCSPKRDNPYDPNSDLYNPRTTLRGCCLSRTNIPIPDARIRLRLIKDHTFYETFTDSQGRYEIIDCPAESILVSAEKENFAPETTSISPVVYKVETLNFILEGLPKILNADVFSHYCQRHIPYDSAVLTLRCEVKDEEGQGDIASVFGVIEGLADTLPLLFQSGLLYEKSFREESLSRSLDEIIGRNISIWVKDIFGHLVHTNPLHLIRVIRNPPEPVSPLGGDSVSHHPILVWRPFNYRYEHSFFVLIYRIIPNLEPILYRRYENIPKSDTSLLVTDSLIPGYYYWQIGVLDSYNNWAKSAEAVFRVGSLIGR